jgi:hypothetical protein
MKSMVAPTRSFSTHLSPSLKPTPETLNPNFVLLLALSNDEIYGCISKVFFNTHPSLSLSLSKPYTPNPKFFSSFVHKY